MIQSGTTLQGKIEIEIKSFLCLLSDIGIPCYGNSASCWHSFVCTIWIPIKDLPHNLGLQCKQGMIEIQYFLCNLSDIGIPLPHKSPHSGRGLRDNLGLQCKEWQRFNISSVTYQTLAFPSLTRAPFRQGSKRQNGTTVQGKIEIEIKSFLCLLSDIGIPCYVNSASCWHSFVCTIWIPIKDPPSQEPPFRQGSKRQSGTTVQGMIEIQYSLCNLSEFGIPLPHKSPHSGKGLWYNLGLQEPPLRQGAMRQSGTTV